MSLFADYGARIELVYVEPPFDVLLRQNKATEVSFRTPDTRGRYVVLVRTLTPEGEVYAASAEFRVE